MEIQNKIGEQVFDKLRSKFKQITLGARSISQADIITAAENQLK